MEETRQLLHHSANLEVVFPSIWNSYGVVPWARNADSIRQPRLRPAVSNVSGRTATQADDQLDLTGTGHGHMALVDRVVASLFTGPIFGGP